MKIKDFQRGLIILIETLFYQFVHWLLNLCFYYNFLLECLEFFSLLTCYCRVVNSSYALSLRTLADLYYVFNRIHLMTLLFRCVAMSSVINVCQNIWQVMIICALQFIVKNNLGKILFSPKQLWGVASLTILVVVVLATRVLLIIP